MTYNSPPAVVEELTRDLLTQLKELTAASVKQDFTLAEAREHLANLLVAAENLAHKLTEARKVHDVEAQQVEQILELLSALAALDFSQRITLHGDGGTIDAIAMMSNWLGEELEASQRALGERNVLLQSVLDSMGEGVVVADANAQILVMNSAARSILRADADGIAIEDWPARFGILAPDGRRRLLVSEIPLVRALAGTSCDEVEMVLDDGTFLIGAGRPLLDVAGERRGSIMVFRDATERRRAERVIQRLATIVESSDDAIVSCDLTGKITTWNRAAEALYGCSTTDAIGTPITRFVAPDRRAEYAAIQRNIAEGKHVSHFEMVALGAGGARINVSLSASPLLDGVGDVIGMSTIARDLTVTQRMAAELVRAKEAAEAATAAKSQFLANMSHDIRTPLTALLGFADFLLAPGLAESDRLNYAMVIRRNSQHLLSLLNDILDLSKIEAGRLELSPSPCSLAELLGDLASLMRARAAERSIAFEIVLTTPVPAVIVTDATRLRQILLNLVGNAIKFTQEGRVSIQIRYSPEPRPELTIDVIDTGIGMTPDQIAVLFTPFQQADPSMSRRFGGTGLGLAISQPLAEALGGTIRVRSEPNIGSTFTLSLQVAVPPRTPLLDSLVEHPGDPISAGVESTAASLAGVVLLAEDGPDNQVLIGTILRRWGLSVLVAENGEAALAMATSATAAGTPFDLILMDMQLPLLDGYAATTQLRRNGYDGPIIALTANAMMGEEERCLQAGCDAYLSKPVDRHALRLTLAHHLDARRAKPGTAPSTGPLVSAFADDPEMQGLLGRFVGSLEARLQTLREAPTRDAMRRLAHQLKGAAGGYGFPSITDAAAALEQALDADAPSSEVSSLLEALTALCKRAQAARGTSS